MASDFKIDVNEVRDRAAHRWEGIVASAAPQLDAAINRKGKHVPCPVHGGVDGFRLMRKFDEVGSGVCNSCGLFKDGFALLMWANQWTFREALEEVAQQVGIDVGKERPKSLPRLVQPIKVNPAADEALRNKLRHTYEGSVPITSPQGEVGRMYLRSRGLSIVPERLRVHPSLYYFEKDREGKTVRLGPFFALIAVVEAPDGRAVTLHRTYLTAQGRKAPVSSVKKMMSNPSDVDYRGVAIKLFACGKTLAVAEGIETATSVTEATGIPCWPLVSSSFMPSFVPPASVENLIVFADKDRPSVMHPRGAGQEQGLALVKNAWARGIKSSLCVPAGEIPDGAKSLDWNDVYREGGRNAVESALQIRRA